MSGAGLTVAVVGLGFGAAFVPLYLCHPDVDRVVLVEADETRRAEVAATFALDPGYSELHDALTDPAVDAVHLLTPVFLHAEMAVEALRAGKHVACAVPMATTAADLDRIIAAQQASGRTYMMMETAVYAREFSAVRRMAEAGELGELTLYRGFHLQNLDGFPAYWQGYPPMHYLTHALSPILALLDTTVQSVTCRGAGRLAPERRTGGFDNQFPTEVGLFSLRGSDVLADITMAFSQTARSYLEGFSLYGDRRGIEWPVDNVGPLTVFDLRPPDPGHRGNRVDVTALDPPDTSERLPPSLRQFVRPSRFRLPTMAEPVTVGGDHGGSHPYLVDEFVTSVVTGRTPFVDCRRAADWTAPGLSAHASAMAGGAEVLVPGYTRDR
jgi:predicted dehydrogenase